MSAAAESRAAPALRGFVDAVTSGQMEGWAFEPGRPAEHVVVELRLSPGMPTEIFVLGETRSALDYLVSPIRDSPRRALQD